MACQGRTKVGVAKLKAYVAEAAAGERWRSAWGDGSRKAPQGLRRAIGLF